MLNNVDGTRYIVAGDTWPPLAYDVRYDDPSLDITDDVPPGSECRFTLKKRRSKLKPIDHKTGILTLGDHEITVSLSLEDGDTDVRGTYDLFIELIVDGEAGHVGQDPMVVIIE